MKVAVLDTETGGLNPDHHSLLSVGIVILDLTTGEILDKLAVDVAEDLIIADPEALAVNRIDINEHKLKGVTVVEAAERITEFLGEHFPDEAVTIAGHNVWFDVRFITRLYRLAGHKAVQFVARVHTLDTASIGVFLMARNPLLVDSGWPSLSKMLATYGVTIPEEKRHTALGDAVATAQLLVRMVKQGENVWI